MGGMSGGKYFAKKTAKRVSYSMAKKGYFKEKPNDKGYFTYWDKEEKKHKRYYYESDSNNQFDHKTNSTTDSASDPTGCAIAIILILGIIALVSCS